jgi:hypothetical protein
MASGVLRMLLAAVGPTLVEKGINGLTSIANYVGSSDIWNNLKSAGTNVMNRFLGRTSDNQVANNMPVMSGGGVPIRMLRNAPGMPTPGGFPTMNKGAPIGFSAANVNNLRSAARDLDRNYDPAYWKQKEIADRTAMENRKGIFTGRYSTQLNAAKGVANKIDMEQMREAQRKPLHDVNAMTKAQMRPIPKPPARPRKYKQYASNY